MTFPIKTQSPGESLDYKFDWGSTANLAPFLEPGETIAAFTLSVPVGLVQESAAIADSGRSVVVFLSGGTLGVDYAVTCSITTNASRTAERTMTIAIRKK